MNCDRLKYYTLDAEEAAALDVLLGTSLGGAVDPDFCESSSGTAIGTFLFSHAIAAGQS